MKFVPKAGTFQAQVFDNPQIGYPPSLFYDLSIPIDLFDTGLSYEADPVTTTFDLDFLKLPVPDWRTFDGQTFVLDAAQSSDATINLGGFANPLGVLVGAIVFGVVESFSNYINSAFGDLYPLLLVMALLVIKPSGLFGEAKADVR